MASALCSSFAFSSQFTSHTICGRRGQAEGRGGTPRQNVVSRKGALCWFGTALLAAESVQQVPPSLLLLLLLGKQCRAPRDQQMATTVSPALMLPPRLLHHPKIPGEKSNQPEKNQQKKPHTTMKGRGQKGTKHWRSTSTGVVKGLAACVLLARGIRE